MADISPRRATAGVLLLLLACTTLVFSGKLVENIAASDYVVIQSPFTGELKWALKPGPVWQGLGDVTAYNIRMRYDFREVGYAVQFNDGGHGTIYGSIQCDLPADAETLTALHRKFPSQVEVESALIKTATEGAIYLTGTLMSSRESYAEKKNDLIHYITDQVQLGPYRTRQHREWTKDPITNESKEVIGAEIILNKDGKAERQEQSALSQYGIKCYQFTINRVAYDPKIQAQIEQQQQITMSVQTSIADKVLAEQRAQTAEANGRTDATVAKWKQETIKAQAVTLAEQEKSVQVTNAQRDKEVAETAGAQRLAVADFDRRSAEQKKLELTLLGEGEGARKKAVLEADGALEQKLVAYTTVMPKIFEALKGTAFVPSVQMGGGSGQATTAASLIDLLTAKTAKDLALDMTMPAKRP